MRLRDAGFTLIEAMVVVAILSIIAALALYGYDAIDRRAAPQIAATDFGLALARARTTAIERNSNVWLIIFPEAGSYFMVDDPNADFSPTAYGSFSPLVTSPGGTTARLLAMESIAQTSRGRAQFGVAAGGAPDFPPPFGPGGLPIPAAGQFGCSFCTGTPRKGAVLFTGEGTAQFIDATGAVVAGAGGTASGRATSLSISGSANAPAPWTYLFAVSSVTGFIGVYPQ